MDFPLDLIIEILLRLPVVSLLRVKSVCRMWNNIISSPSFVQKHLMFHQSSTSDFSNFLWCFESNFTDYETAHGIFCPNESPPYYETIGTRIVGLIGPCNGVYLVSQDSATRRTLALWNPATRRIKLLPPPPDNFKDMNWSLMLGLGVDPLAPVIEFKIVILDYACDKPYFAVYNSSTQLWKLVEDPILIVYAFEISCHGIFANGFIYWLMFKEYTLEYLLLAMDLRNDSFLIIKVPCTRLLGFMPQAMRLLTPRLGLYNGSLALLKHVEGDILPEATIMVDLWFMEEQGCWTKLTTTSLLFEFDSILGFIGFWSRSKIYINKDDKTAIIYDIDSGTTTEFEFQKAREYLKAYSDPFPYQPTLVSI